MSTFQIIQQRLEEARQVLPEATPRTVIYLPFANETNLKGGEVKQSTKAESYRDHIGMRSLATQLADKTGETSLSDDRLVELFDDATEEEQKEMLKEAAAKIPVIIQHGQEHPGVTVRPQDSVMVFAHGSHDLNWLAAVQNPVALNQRCGSEQLMRQMQQDGVPDNVAKIKFTSCGSGGEFHKAFVKSCTEHGRFENATIRSYEGETHSFFSAKAPLSNLDRGRHTVTPIGTGEATRQFMSSQEEINEKLESLKFDRTMAEMDLSVHDFDLDNEGATEKRKLQRAGIVQRLENIDLQREQIVTDVQLGKTALVKMREGEKASTKRVESSGEVRKTNRQLMAERGELPSQKKVVAKESQGCTIL